MPITPANYAAWITQVDTTIGHIYSQMDPRFNAREIATEIQRSVHDNVSVVILGQFAGPSAYRANLQGVLDVGFPVLWNVQRAAR